MQPPILSHDEWNIISILRNCLVINGGRRIMRPQSRAMMTNAVTILQNCLVVVVIDGWGEEVWIDAPTKSLFPTYICDLQPRAMAMEHHFLTILFVGYPYRYQKWQGRWWGEQVWTQKPLFPTCLAAAFGEKRAVVKGICERPPNLEPSR